MKYEKFEFEKEPVERRKKKQPTELLSDLKHRFGTLLPDGQVVVTEAGGSPKFTRAMGSHESVAAFKKRVGW